MKKYLNPMTIFAFIFVMGVTLFEAHNLAAGLIVVPLFFLLVETNGLGMIALSNKLYEIECRFTCR